MAPEPTMAKVRLHEPHNPAREQMAPGETMRCHIPGGAFGPFRVAHKNEQPATIVSGAERPAHIEDSSTWLTLVDLGQLTERQREALRAARDTGYFRPGGGDVAQLARLMQCSRSTAHEHLQKAMLRLVELLQGTC